MSTASKICNLGKGVHRFFLAWQIQIDEIAFSKKSWKCIVGVFQLVSVLLLCGGPEGIFMSSDIGRLTGPLSRYREH